MAAGVNDIKPFTLIDMEIALKNKRFVLIGLINM